jgi:peptidoglycan/xylan/chitin deacetylase (PgdA/CDA1 family)
MRRLPLPAWLFLASLAAFLATWLTAPRSSLSGRAREAPPPERAGRAPLLLAPFDLASGVADGPRVLPGRVRSRRHEVALTFDDGPHPFNTARLLRILAEHDVRAAFFVNGAYLRPGRRNAEACRRVLAAAHRGGHIIGNHTYHHVNLTRLPPERQTWEILANDRVILEATGERPLFFRPPYAVISRHSLALLRQHGYREARWNASVYDEERRSPEEIRDAVLGWLRHHDGGIVMLHDQYRASVDATALLLAALKVENHHRAATGQPPFRLVALDSFLLSPAESAASGDDAVEVSARR